MINSSAYKEFSSIESTATSDLLNQALQRVEEFALAVLACQTPEVCSIHTYRQTYRYVYIHIYTFINSLPILLKDVLAKVMFSELASTMTSVVNISEEEAGIWSATLIKPKPAKSSEVSADSVKNTSRLVLEERPSNSATDNTTLGNADGNYSSTVPGTVKDSVTEMVATPSPVGIWSELSPEFIPLAVQLRPYWPDRSLNGLFRLFFLDEELVAATQYCPCVFFSEVMVDCKYMDF